MEDKCPECGETLITKTIQKKLGSGSIDYPIAVTCGKCKWNKDLTGAGDIVGKPVMADAGASEKYETTTQIRKQVATSTISKPINSSGGVSKLIPIILAIFVVGAIAYVFFMNPAQEEQTVATTTPGPIPIITQTPVPTPSSTPAPEVTASGNQFPVYLEVKKGFTPKIRTIKVGDGILWTNNDIYSVTLVSKDGLFYDKFLNNAKRTNYTFLKAGTFSFVLKGNDTGLSGTIIVQP
ncbi:MAG: hypothetical protein OIN87_06740 [Candidatus Methanoperedens sp.]|nr:hypothetical protein [Candidatus Methanoperedens sp.]